jgi:kynureninase
LISPLADENTPKVIPDFRSPDNIRLGITPLYTSYQDIYRALQRLKQIIEQEIYLKYPEERSAVT